MLKSSLIDNKVMNTIYPILSYGNPSLVKSSNPIKYKTDLSELISNMFYTMSRAEGCGLAAPQIGKNEQLFIINLSNLEMSNKFEKDKYIFINPKIIEQTGDFVIYQEGCLSIPNIFININRQPQLKLRYYDENWQLHENTFDGLIARVIQHEYDHLKGILHIAYATSNKRKKIKSQLDDIKLGKIKTSYQMYFPSTQ